MLLLKDLQEMLHDLQLEDLDAGSRLACPSHRRRSHAPAALGVVVVGRLDGLAAMDVDPTQELLHEVAVVEALLEVLPAKTWRLEGMVVVSAVMAFIGSLLVLRHVLAMLF